MDAQQFLVEFGHVANSPRGIEKLREMILSLAVRGMLVSQDLSEQPASDWLLTVERARARLASEGRIPRVAPLPEIHANDTPFSAPPGWTFARLGRIASKIGSGSTPRGGKQVYLAEGIPFLRSQNVWNYGLRMDDVAYISAATHEAMSGTSVEANDLLLNITGASLGRCALVPRDFGQANVSQHVTIIRLVDASACRYLHLCLLSPLLQGMIWGRQVGMAREGLSKKVLEQFEIPIPPMKEQSRIVAKVDELMALCEKLETQLKDRRRLQCNLRQSTLQAVAAAAHPLELQTTWERLAVNFGQLFSEPADVADLDQCAKQLALKGLLTNRHAGEQVSAELVGLTTTSAGIGEGDKDWPIPQHWIWARCGWLGEARLGKMLDASKNKGELRPYLRNVNVRWHDFDLTDVLQMRVEEHELPRVTVKRGDLVVCEGGEPGRAAIWNRDDEFVIQKALHRYRCSVNVVPEYLLFCLEHDFFSRRLARFYTGSTIKHLTGKALAEYAIPLPPVEEQRRILHAATRLTASLAKLNDQLGERNRCIESFAAATVAALTGVALANDEEDSVKAPQTELIAPLRLGTVPGVKAQAPLATLLARHDGEMSARDL